MTQNIASTLEVLMDTMWGGAHVEPVRIIQHTPMPEDETVAAWLDFRMGIDIARGAAAWALVTSGSFVPPFPLADALFNENVLVRVACMLEARLDEYVAARNIKVLDRWGKSGQRTMENLIRAVSGLVDNADALHQLRADRNDIAHDNKRDVCTTSRLEAAYRAVEQALGQLGVMSSCPELKNSIVERDGLKASAKSGEKWRRTLRLGFTLDGTRLRDYEWDYVYAGRDPKSAPMDLAASKEPPSGT